MKRNFNVYILIVLFLFVFAPIVNSQSTNTAGNVSVSEERTPIMTTIDEGTSDTSPDTRTTTVPNNTTTTPNNTTTTTKPNNTTTTTTPRVTVSQEDRLLSALRNNPQNADAYYNLLEYYRENGNRRQRIQIAARAITQLGSTPGLNSIIADEYRFLGETERALVYYQNAIKLDPTIHSVYYRMGLVLMKIPKYHEAEVAFKAALYFLDNTQTAETDKAAAKAQYLYNLGLCYENREEYKKAEYYYTQAIEYDTAKALDKASSNLERIRELLKSKPTN